MTFFYDLNKKLSDLAAKQTLNEGKKPDFLDVDKDGDKKESFKKAVKDKEVAEGKDEGKPGKMFAKIAKSAGKHYGSKEAGERVAGAVRQKLKKAGKLEEEQVEEGILDTVKKVGGAIKKGAGKALDTLGHGSDEDMIRLAQKQAGVPQTGKKPTSQVKEAHGDYQQIIDSMSSDVAQFKQSGELSDALYNALFDCWHDEMPYGTAKARTGDPYQWIGDRLEQELGMNENVDKVAFAKLAPPTDKITFADKIAGAKKEVDEMLGDVAAQAMKKAIGGHGEEVSEEEDRNPFTNWKKPRVDRPRVGDVEHGSKHDIKHTATGRVVTRRTDPNTGHSVGADDDAPASGEKRGRGRPAGKGAGKSIGAKGPSGKSKLMTREGADQGQVQQIYNDLADIRTIAKQAQRGGQFPQGFASRLESAIWAAMTLIKNQQAGDAQVREEESTNKKDSHAEKAGRKVTKDIEYDEKKKNGIHGKKRGTEDDKAEKAGKEVTKDIEYDEKKSKKKDVEENTVAGAVATAPAKASKGGIFGKGVYEGAIAESFNKKLDTVLTEGMSINLSVGEDGTKSLSVNATDEDAEQLAQLLKMAGLGGDAGEQQACSTCGESACGCQPVQEELANAPSPNYSNTDTMVNTLSGGLNGRKTTGQTTIPVIANQDRQTSVAESSESRLWELYQRYSNK